jgi:hypothetical protein
VPPAALAFPVHPDPISGMQCWHQAVRVSVAVAGDRHGDIVVDTTAARRVYQEWLRLTRPAGSVSPDGRRRPKWLMRPCPPYEDLRTPGWCCSGSICGHGCRRISVRWPTWRSPRWVRNHDQKSRQRAEQRVELTFREGLTPESEGQRHTKG